MSSAALRGRTQEGAGHEPARLISDHDLLKARDRLAALPLLYPPPYDGGGDHEGLKRTNPIGSLKPFSATLSSRAGSAATNGCTAGSSATARLSTMSPPALWPCRRAAMFTVEPK